MRSEQLIYKLTSKGFWIQDAPGGGKVFISTDDVAAGMKYGKITGLEYHVLLSLVQPPMIGDRIIQLRQMHKPKDKQAPAKFSEEEAYRYLIDQFISNKDLELYFYQHMAGVAYGKKWRLKKGTPVLRYFGRIVLAEKMFPWLRTCSSCWGRGERDVNGVRKACRACTGQRSADAPTGGVVYIGSGMKDLSGRAMARLLEIDQSSYEETWKDRKRTFEMEYDAQIMSALKKLAFTVYNEQAEEREKAPAEKTWPDPVKAVQEARELLQQTSAHRVKVNHRAGGRQTLSLGGARC